MDGLVFYFLLLTHPANTMPDSERRKKFPRCGALCSRCLRVKVGNVASQIFKKTLADFGHICAIYILVNGGIGLCLRCAESSWGGSILAHTRSKWCGSSPGVEVISCSILALCRYEQRLWSTATLLMPMLLARQCATSCRWKRSKPRRLRQRSLDSR